jgi:hypothetical protein
MSADQLKEELATQEKNLAQAVQQVNVQAGAVEMLKVLISRAEAETTKESE